MTCEELRDEYVPYALGIAEDPERQEIARHLDDDCPNCVPGVRKAMETVAAMSGAVKLVDPPARLRRRIVGLVTPGKESKGWFPGLLPWALSGILAAGLVFVAVTRQPQRDATAKLLDALSILNDPTAKDVSFGQPTARGRVFVSPERGVVFIAAGLPHLDPHRTFELWVIPTAGNPIPAGTFVSEAGPLSNDAVYVHPGPIANAAALAVTIEPEGGSPQPTTTPFIVAKL